MGGKHDVLTETEFAAWNLNVHVSSAIEAYISRHPDKKTEDINILDWGCGRGRSVLRLREQGFNAFGVDIDQGALTNGFAILEGRGLSPAKFLKPVEEVDYFRDGFFDIIFSEQVIEHVFDLAGVIEQIERLTVPGGIGVHCFPGAGNVWEGHLYMPFVHWLPTSFFKKCWIAVLLVFSFGPKTMWPEVKKKKTWGQAEVYCNYINEKTFYRDSDLISDDFEKTGLKAEYKVTGKKISLHRFLPACLRRNGFPRGGIVLHSYKKE